MKYQYGSGSPSSTWDREDTGPNHYNQLQQTEMEIMGVRQHRPSLFLFPSVVDGCNDLGPVSSLFQVDEGEPDPYWYFISESEKNLCQIEANKSFSNDCKQRFCDISAFERYFLLREYNSKFVRGNWWKNVISRENLRQIGYEL